MDTVRIKNGTVVIIMLVQKVKQNIKNVLIYKKKKNHRIQNPEYEYREIYNINIQIKKKKSSCVLTFE